MIRTFTVICCALAAGAVLYTYQSKHEVQLLDRQIEKTLADTATLRDQSRALKAEWTLRENPERLRTFADQYLNLKPVLPTQFTTMAELDSRLPAPRVMPPDSGTTDTTEDPADTPVASSQPATETPDEPEVADEGLPVPPMPVPPPVAIAASAAPPAPQPAAAPAPAPVVAATPAPAPAPATPSVMAERKPVAPRPVPPRPSVTATAAPPIQLQPAPASAPVVRTQVAREVAHPAPPMQAAPLQAAPVQAAPVRAVQLPPRSQPAPMPAPQPMQGGSLLGMAHGGSFAPVPRPMPVSTTQWPNGN